MCNLLKSNKTFIQNKNEFLLEKEIKNPKGVEYENKISVLQTDYKFIYGKNIYAFLLKTTDNFVFLDYFEECFFRNNVFFVEKAFLFIRNDSKFTLKFDENFLTICGNFGTYNVKLNRGFQVV